MELGETGRKIEAKLKSAFSPTRLEVIDESHRHAGHAGARPEGETHFRVVLRAQAFAGKSRVEQHRLVNATLAEELRTRVHALSIDAGA